MLYMARRHLGMHPEEWDGCSWDLQRTYAEGFIEEKLITRNEAPEGDGEPDGMTHRKADTGSNVIDLNEMIRQLRPA